MDNRITLRCNETFYELLLNCLQHNSKVAMLLDDCGLVRAEGFIRRIVTDVERPYVELESGVKIVLQTITAVNGIFGPSYSEC